MSSSIVATKFERLGARKIVLTCHFSLSHGSLTKRGDSSTRRKRAENPCSRFADHENSVLFSFRLDELDVAATLRGPADATAPVLDDSPQEKIASGLRKFEIVVNGRLTEWCDFELCRKSCYSVTLYIFERQGKRALDLSILVVDQHHR